MTLLRKAVVAVLATAVSFAGIEVAVSVPAHAASYTNVQASASSQPVLRLHAQGTAVETLQRMLGGLSVDGDFGPLTQAHVIAFQRAHGLTPDGVVGPKTWAALYGTSPAQSSPPPAVNLHAGMPNSTLVGDLQAALDTSKRGSFGYPHGDYDGLFGSTTKAVLTAWQQATGHTVTGTINVGSGEWNQLMAESTLPKPPAGVELVSVASAVIHGYAVDENLTENGGMTRVLQHTAQGLTVTLSTRSSNAGWAKNTRGVLQHYNACTGVYNLYYRDPLGPRAYSAVYGHAAMPWAVYYCGGDAFHQDGLFDSHGCTHIPSLADAKYIYYLPPGTPVAVHR